LGIIFSNNGFWHDHVDYIVKKSYTRLNMLRKVSANKRWTIFGRRWSMNADENSYLFFLVIFHQFWSHK
jgi:hypothetical protein